MKLYNQLEIPNHGLGTFLLEGEEAYHSVMCALKAGYRLIDTAAIYNNEREVGKAIADSKINREEVMVSTKLLAKKRGYQEAIEECKKSLTRLNLKYIDIYLIHWMPRSYDELLDTWRGLEYLYEQGYCRAIGVCNITLYYLDMLIKDSKIKPMLCQIECHPFLQQELFIEYCHKRDIQVVSYGMFAKGMVFQNKILQKLSEEYKTSIANLIISWGRKRSLITLSKSAHPDRIISNLKNNFIMSEDLLKKMTELNDGIRVYRDPENNPYI